LILQTTARALQPLLLFFSVFLLLRGHQHPGGGFVGGLLAAGAFTIHGIAFGIDSARQSLRIDPRTLIGIGLATAVASGSLSLLRGQPLLTSIWVSWGLGARRLDLGTPLLFDAGVYLLVMGTTLTIVLALGEE
jgi:multicomponent Na+:H+ antiporter subunit B